MTYPYPSKVQPPPSSPASAFVGTARPTTGEAIFSVVLAFSRAGVMVGLILGPVAGREARGSAEPTIRAGL